ncbi:MAG: phenylalanine--tRNA ligase beta subunit-related protein [Bacillota bacterium]
MLQIMEALKTTYPGAYAGMLLMRSVSNREDHPALESAKKNLEKELQVKYGNYERSELKEVTPLRQYTAYFKRFKKTYPVLLQLETLVFKGRALPRVSTLVEAMFMAELKNMLLTAGHDWDSLHEPVRIDVSRGDEQYILLNGEGKKLLPGDMLMADSQGIISSVIYGPDQRTRINPGTKNVLFAVYGVPGIAREAIRHHLQDIRDNVLLFAPQARAELLDVY